MTRFVCPSCGHALEGQVRTYEVRQRIALHRQAHEKQERRRKSWRESAARRYARKTRPGWIGTLHSLSCTTRHHSGNAKCVPIPVYE